MSERNPVVVWFTAATLLLVVLGWYFGPAAWTMFQDRKLARENPALLEVPKQLTDLRQSAASGPTLSYMGYTFRTPWGEVDETKQKLFAGVAAIPFKSHTALVVFGAAGFTSGIKKTASDKQVDLAPLKSVFGDSFASDYDFTKAQLESVPGQTGLFTSKQELARHSMFLMMKAIATPANGPIYYVQNGDMRGFQYGEPGHRLMVQLFGKHRGVEIVFPTQANGAPISQEDVNCVIQSLRPAISSSADAGK